MLSRPFAAMTLEVTGPRRRRQTGPLPYGTDYINSNIVKR